MMEAVPAASFVVTQTEFLFQFMAIAFYDPSMFGYVRKFPQTTSDGRVDSQYLVGSDSPARHSISNHSSGCGSDCQ